MGFIINPYNFAPVVVSYPDGLGSSADCTDIGSPSKTNTGKVGNAWSFNGSSSSVRMNNNISFIGTSDFTINLWVKTSTTTRSNIFGIYHTDVNDVQMELRATGQLRFNVNGAYDSTNSINTGNWVMLTCTRTGGNLKIFVNAVSESFNDGGTQDINSSNGANIGGRNRADISTNDLFLNGLMDETSIWLRVLTQAEINTLYNSGSGIALSSSGISTTNLKIYYNYEQTSGNLINQAIP